MIALNVAMSIPMYAWLGVRGLAAGHALAYTLGVLLLTKALNDRIGPLEVARLRRAAVRIGVATAGMSALVWISLQAVDRIIGSRGTAASVAEVAVATVVGLISYLGLAALLRLDEVAVVRNLLSKRLQSSQAA